MIKCMSEWFIVGNAGQTWHLVIFDGLSSNRVTEPGHLATIMCPIYNQLQLTCQNGIPLTFDDLSFNRVAEPGHLANIMILAYNQL